jgi:F420-dependent oxidoreductase-like protein
MELRIFTEPQQGATYDQQLRLARKAEALGFAAYFRSDHYLHMGKRPPGVGPSDAWLTIAGLARETERIRLGTLLSSATFRLPGPLAISVAQADAMSGGRVELGLGAGWYEAEHRAYGISFPPTPERFDRLEEQLEIVLGLWTAEQPFSFAGRHYQIEQSPGLPKPTQRPHPPIIIGGQGKRRTPSLAARFADEFNVPFASVTECAELYGLLDAACEKEGRDPSSLLRSAAVVFCCGENEAEYIRRAAAIGHDPAELRASQAGGTPEEVVARLSEFAEAGAARAYLQILDLDDLEHLELIAEQVMPSLA